MRSGRGGDTFGADNLDAEGGLTTISAAGLKMGQWIVRIELMSKASQQTINEATSFYNTFADGKCRCGGDLVAYGFGMTIPRIFLADPDPRTFRTRAGTREGAAEIVCRYSLGIGLTPAGKALNRMRKHDHKVFAWLPVA
jgi:DMSO/TMAO reductase YedYZ molybdopterin-dependent catalytic subunit